MTTHKANLNQRADARGTTPNQQGSAILDALRTKVPRDLLVPVITCTAARDHTSKINSPGKQPGIFVPAMDNRSYWKAAREWDTRVYTDTELSNCDLGNGNAGLKLGVASGKFQYVALDIDTPKGEPFTSTTLLLTAITAMAKAAGQKHFAVRRTLDYRGLVMFRLPKNADPASKRIMRFTRSLRSPWQIEVLSKGQQTIITGTHAGEGEAAQRGGVPIRWFPKADALPYTGAGEPSFRPEHDTIDVKSMDEVWAVVDQIGVAMRREGWAAEWANDAKAKAKTSPSDGTLPPIERVREALALIPNKDLPWATWKDRMMAIWASTGGSPEGLELATEWSAKSTKFRADGPDCPESTWDAITASPPTELSFGSLVWLARQVDPDFMPKWKKVAGVDEFEPTEEAPRGGSKFEAPEAIALSGLDYPAKITALRKMAADTGVSEADLRTRAIAASVAYDARGNEIYHSTEITRVMYRLNYIQALVTIGEDCRVIRYPQSPGATYEKLKIATLDEEHANHAFDVSTDPKKPKLLTVAELWRKWPKRSHYRGICFEPPPKHTRTTTYNIFQSFPTFAAGPEDWSLLRDHIWRNIAHENSEWFDWIMTWMADIIQFPGRKMGSALVLQGLKGCGKGEVFRHLRALLGSYAIEIAQSRHLVGNFNKHRIAKLLVVADEATFAGNNEAAAILKNLITSETSMLESKGVDVIETSDYVRVGMTSNENWVVQATHDERRYAVFKLLPDKMGDLKFFAAMAAQMLAGGYAAMFRDLKAWVPSGRDWDILRTPPITPWLKEQVRHTIDPSARFFIEFVQHGNTSFVNAPFCLPRLELSETEKTKIAGTDLTAVHSAYVKQYTVSAAVHRQTQAVAPNAKMYLEARAGSVRVPVVQDDLLGAAHSGCKAAKTRLGPPTAGFTIPPLVELRRLHVARGWVEPLAPEDGE